MIPLLILLLLAFPLVAIAAIVMAVTTRERLRAIERRLLMLERRIEAGVTAPPQSAAPVIRPTVAPAVEPPRTTPPPAMPAPAAPKPAVPP
ncbi:MAG TPA: hypothetical protein VKT99_06410, partial [Xanthobacteraceae bacterium]|nr:hypothetical protein [Xanthobacteraceae bacterium]